ncbi:MAG TPA: hypothetical protein VHB20_13980 [Verrucomicrobiae bacterium]|jgi:hypothetical protein|nr:hypothetical protein [Verrucomicrobiae bacterium]
MKYLLLSNLIAAILLAGHAHAGDAPNIGLGTDQAIAAMKKRAAELGIQGVAVIAFSPGESMESWTSKMAVVGRLKKDPAGDYKGDNFLACAYAKASEMAATLRDSGEAGRLPMAGELGWHGGKIMKVKSGLLIAAFSGGKSEDDVKVSEAGLAALAAAL